MFCFHPFLVLQVGPPWVPVPLEEWSGATLKLGVPSCFTFPCSPSPVFSALFKTHFHGDTTIWARGLQWIHLELAVSGTGQPGPLLMEDTSASHQCQHPGNATDIICRKMFNSALHLHAAGGANNWGVNNWGWQQGQGSEHSSSQSHAQFAAQAQQSISIPQSITWTTWGRILVFQCMALIFTSKIKWRSYLGFFKLDLF